MNAKTTPRKTYHASDFMVTKVVTLSQDMDVFDAIEVLLKNRISGAPVLDGAGRYVGVFSERNCLSLVVNAAYEQVPTTALSTFVTTDAPTIEESTDVLTIAQIFLTHNCRRLPVLKNGELVGQVSRRDVLKTIRDQVAGEATPGAQLLYLSSLFAHDDAPV